MNRIALLFFLTFFFYQCEIPHADLSEYHKEKESQKMVSYKDVEGKVLTKAKEKGNRIADKLELNINIDSLAKAEAVTIKIYDDNHKSVFEKENMIYEAFKYNVANGIQQKTNGQLIGNIYIWNKAIIKEGKLNGMWSIQINIKDITF